MKKTLLLSLFATLMLTGLAFASAENQPAAKATPDSKVAQSSGIETPADGAGETKADAAKVLEQKQLQNA
ncbi:MAG: hypothetical protein P8X63_02650, partial [Desulfuromonadaceae bacterium]